MVVARFTESVKRDKKMTLVSEYTTQTNKELVGKNLQKLLAVNTFLQQNRVFNNPSNYSKSGTLRLQVILAQSPVRAYSSQYFKSVNTVTLAVHYVSERHDVMVILNIVFTGLSHD